MLFTVRVAFAGLCLSYVSSLAWALPPTPTSTPDCCQVAVWTPVPTYGSDGNGVVASRSLFVCDSVHDELLQFSLATGVQTGVLPLPAGTEPLGLALGNDGWLYVGGYGGQVILKVPTTGGSAVTVSYGNGLVRALAMDPVNGDLYVPTESNGVRVLKYSAGYVDDGTVLPNTVGLAYGGVWVAPGGQVYLSGAGVVQRFAQLPGYNFGVPVTVADSSTVVTPFNLAMDVAGRLYVASFGNAFYDVFDPSNNYVELNRCPMPDNFTGITVDNTTGDVYLVGVGKIFKASHCWSLTFPTPTPSYAGADPPKPGQCFIYPSPAKGDHATVCYSMAETGAMETRIWNKNGELVTRVTDRKTPGTQVTPISLTGFPRGIYFYSVTLTYDSGKVERLETKKFAVIH